jgi:hypothetical protein
MCTSTCFFYLFDSSQRGGSEGRGFTNVKRILVGRCQALAPH